MITSLAAASALWTLLVAASVEGAEPSSPPPHAVGHAEEVVGLVRRLYAHRQNRALWIEGPGRVSPQAWAALRMLSAAGDDGLNPRDYGAIEIERDLRSVEERPSATSEAGRIDAALTYAVVAYAHDLVHGRVEAANLEIIADLPPLPADIAIVVEDAVLGERIADALAALPPRHDAYRALRERLGAYRAVAEAGGWSAVAGDERMVPGQRYPRARIDAIEAHLVAEGYIAELARPVRRPSPRGRDSDRIYDDRLEEGIRKFQSDRGIEADGVIGRKTLAQLNRPAADIVRTIELNMERWRWAPADLGYEHVTVNIPSFELGVQEGNEERMRMRIIVGQTAWGTPLFSDAIESIVVNPSWNVPHSIATKEILPQVIRDHRALEMGGFEIVTEWGSRGRVVAPDSIDWRGMTPRAFPYRLRQRPGRLNALGRLEFLFPNRFHVYLHDTPANTLFAARSRAFSHGCIRVERPFELARWLLRDDPQWTSEQLAAAIDAGRQRAIRLPRPVPVHVLYATAWVNDEGRLELREDVYGIDTKLARALDELAAFRDATVR